jgi:hypothetical protein
MLSVDDLFKGRHFYWEIIILCVRWYLRFKLSFRDLVGMMAERAVVQSCLFEAKYYNRVTAVRLSAEGGVDRLFVAKG